MNSRTSFAIIYPIVLCCLVSCAQVSKRMPAELSRMHYFLTQDEPGTCQRYHYNFERQAPKLYRENQTDSIFDIIEYIKTKCGPAANLEVTRMLLMADRGQFDDSLIGSSTIPQMLWYRSEQESLLNWRQFSYLYGSSQPIDNTHDSFSQFRDGLAQHVSSLPGATPTGQMLGLFYSGSFDSAFSQIQSQEFRGNILRENYDDFVRQTKRMFPARGNIGILVGSWRPQGNNDLLGNHPDIGIHLGGEGKLLRADVILSHRFLSAKNEFLVDSLGNLVATDKFNSWLFGVDGGIKFLDYSKYSADLFVGIGYDVIYSVSRGGEPEEHVSHGSFAVSVGLRQRIFLDQRTGWYIGGVVRYGNVDYGNPGGTNLSGNTLTVSFVCGWSFHETLKQFLQKLNYKGNWRK